MDDADREMFKPNSHPFQERHVPLTEPTKIGRSVARCRPSPNNAVFDCKVLSRNHALLWFENGKFYLQDTKSSNGTFVNNQRLSKAGEESGAVEVNSYDVVQFGVDVVDSMRKVTHGCIVSQLRLYLPNGEESQQRNCAWNNKLIEKIPNINPSMQSQDLYQLHHYLQEALHREQMLEQKLALLQRLLLNSQDASEKGWQALIDEDRLLSRLEFLENQLQAYNKTQTDDSLKNQLQQVQEEKYNYENTSKETLRQALQEKLEAVRKLSNTERCLSNSEDECTHLRHIQEQTQNELASLAASHQSKVEEVNEIMEKLQEAERKHVESTNEIESQKVEMQKKFEALKEEEEKLRRNVDLLEEDNKRLKILSESQQTINETTRVDAEVQYENEEEEAFVSTEKPRIPVVTQQKDDAGPFQLTVDEVLGELDDIMDNSDDEDFTNVDGLSESKQATTVKESSLVAQIKELEEKLEEVERQKQEEEESRRKVELAFDEYKREIETRDAQLLETNKEVHSCLYDAESQRLLGHDQEQSLPEADKYHEFVEKMELLQAENLQLQDQLQVQQAGETKTLANEAFAVGDASVGEKASDDNKLDEELTETKFIVTEQENQIKLLEEKLQTAQANASVVSELESELAMSRSRVQSQEAKLLKVEVELKESKTIIADQNNDIAKLKDELSLEREASLKQLSVCEGLRETCGKQSDLIEALQKQEVEASKKLEETQRSLTMKEKSALELEEELSECTRQKEDCQSEFNVLNQSFVEVEREKQSIAEQLQQLEVSIREHEVQMKQQEAKNRSLQEAYDEEQKKWENKLYLKDEELAEAIAKSQQRIQAREAAERREAAAVPMQKWVLLGLFGATLALVYFCFFSQFPDPPI